MTTPAHEHAAPEAWQSHLIDDDHRIAQLLRSTKRIAVLGIKTEETGAPAFYVPQYAQKAGFEILPVPIYFPDVTEILGQKVVRTVSAIAGPVDLVNVFRRPKDIDQHVDDILSKKPKSVWFQQGIRNPAAAERFARAGIDVVQDRCLLVELQSIGL